MSNLNTALATLSCVAGGLLISSGVWGLLSPLSAARDLFGIPSATAPEVLFYPALAVRNVAAGAAVISLLYQSHYPSTTPTTSGKSTPASSPSAPASASTAAGAEAETVSRTMRHALGTLLMAWCIVGLGDTLVLSSHASGGEGHGVHLFNVVWIFATGFALRFR